MSNTFTITYANGMSEDVQMDLETAEEVSNAVFGKTLEQAAEIGCNVVLVGEFVPEEPDLTGTIISFTQGNPTVATTDLEDQGILVSGSKITLEALTGTADAMEYINGLTVDVIAVAPLITLDLDLSTVDVAGLTADYLIEVVEEEEEPPADDPPADDPPADCPAPAPASAQPWNQT
jgi:hypothetical protein